MCSGVRASLPWTLYPAWFGPAPGLLAWCMRVRYLGSTLGLPSFSNGDAVTKPSDLALIMTSCIADVKWSESSAHWYRKVAAKDERERDHKISHLMTSVQVGLKSNEKHHNSIPPQNPQGSGGHGAWGVVITLPSSSKSLTWLARGTFIVGKSE